MPVPREILEEIRARTDIVDLIGAFVSLKRAGASYKGLCPFHKEKTPSFTVNPARQIFHCFGCGAGGDIFKFVMLHDNVDFMDAVRILAERAGVKLVFSDEERGEAARKDLLYRIHDEAARFFHDILLRHKSADAAREYLKERKLGPDVVERFQLGYAPDAYDVMERFAEKRKFPLDAMEAAGLIARAESGRRYDRFRGRLMFPIRDPAGRVIAFSGRILSKDDRAAKYVNSPETPLFRKSRTLFALDQAKKSILDQGVCLLCEGQIDVIRCHMAGFTNAVAALGTAVTEEHAAIIKRHAERVLLVMDADAAGQASARRSAEIFLAADLFVEVVTLPVGEDPDSLIVKRGAEAMRELLERPKNVVDFLIDLAEQREDLGKPIVARRVAKDVLQAIGRAPSRVAQQGMIRQLASRLNIPEHTLREDLREIKALSSPDSKENSPTRRKSPPVPPAERDLLWILTHYPETVPLFARYISAEHLTDSRVRHLYGLLTANPNTDLMEGAREGGEDCVALAAEALADDRHVGTEEDAAQRAAQDIILVIRRDALERALYAAQQARQNAPAEEQERLSVEIAHLKYDLFAIKEGWDRASLILEL